MGTRRHTLAEDRRASSGPWSAALGSACPRQTRAQTADHYRQCQLEAFTAHKLLLNSLATAPKLSQLGQNDFAILLHGET